MLVTADDFIALKKRIIDRTVRLESQRAAQLFERLVSSIEPRLVITNAGGAVEWLELTMSTQEAIRASQLGLASGLLDQMADIARKYWKASGPLPQQVLSFIKDPALRRIAEEDWNRVIGAAQREDAKTTAIAAGSVVEAIAIDILERLSTEDATKLKDHVNGLKKGRPEQKSIPSDWKFAFLLLAIGPDGLKVLGDRTHDIGHKLRDWRNYVHPPKSRKEDPLTPADGRLAAGFAEKVIDEVTGWQANGGQLVVPP
ncbi:hypothetical protein [Archangium sp.]|uniref:hypothetical protein n=1 Tax=Archangium sp. TaxID=1872627 RepID=UPI002D5706CA|nr:hypothetical protein [Archangium sp.]HYO54315.1 hypothetical protein [Archangium sp.]